MSEDNPGGSDAKPVDPRLARRRQDALGRRLRQMYDEVVEEPVPDDFMSFLEQADRRPAQSSSSDASSTQSRQSRSDSDHKDG